MKTFLRQVLSHINSPEALEAINVTVIIRAIKPSSILLRREVKLVKESR